MKYDQLYFKIIRQVLISVGLFLFPRELKRRDSFIGMRPLKCERKRDIIFLLVWHVVSSTILSGTELYDEESALSNISVYIRRRVIKRYRRNRSPNVSTWKQSLPTIIEPWKSWWTAIRRDFLTFPCQACELLRIWGCRGYFL